MSTKAQKVRVGIFVAVSAALLALVLIVFGGLRFWRDRAQYKIVFDDSVIGLQKGAQVYRNGIKVGRVKDISLHPEDMNKVVVTVTIDGETPIHTDTTAQLQLAGITGLKLIDLRGGTATAPRIPEGGTIPRGQSLLDRLSAKAEHLVDQSEQIMQRAYDVVDNLARVSDPQKFDAILASTKNTAANLERASSQLDTMIAENRAAVRDTVASVKTTADTTRAIFQEQITGLVGRATEVLADVRNLVRGSEGQVRSAVFDLRQASRNLKEMSRDVRARPSRLLFSNPPPERKLP